jgi:TRAP-type C4-dicarboxylate transport system permease small subunit
MFSVFRLIEWISGKMMLLGGILLFSIVILTCVDVVGRMMGYPVFGTYELVSFMAALIVAAALPDTQAEKRHIGVEIVTNKLSPKVVKIIDMLTGLAALILFSIVTWRMFLYGNALRQSGEVSMNLRLPEYLLPMILGIGFLVFVIFIIKSLIDLVDRKRER